MHAELRCELLEEAGIRIDVGRLLDSWIYDLGELGRVCIVTYLATPATGTELLISEEHSDLRWFPPEEALRATMPQSNKDRIEAASDQRRRPRSRAVIDHRRIIRGIAGRGVARSW
ncbi:NUDIX domain-containing protein [Brachybacterium tyrofermentans]|uniref:NUDIX domain-containing protein n=1 Tax=Brachybacterium tyrofermentans TaxID=47848 RepID=UPI003FD0AAF9